MNCQEVEIMITDLARDGALEAGARDSALAHIDQCRRCSERLVEEKKLSEGLLAWNAACMEERARPESEEKLRAAFRLKAASAPGRRWLKFAAAGSIAAAVLLFRLLTTAPAPRSAPVAVAPAPPPVVVARLPDDAVGATESPAKPVRRKKRASRPRPVETAEVRTEFLPVTQGDGWTPLDGGRLVRVRLPRSAMGVFGLPVDPGRDSERVQADVMLSDDGLLRAIRFVR
jgi:hypothetical protein